MHFVARFLLCGPFATILFGRHTTVEATQLGRAAHSREGEESGDAVKTLGAVLMAAKSRSAWRTPGFTRASPRVPRFVRSRPTMLATDADQGTRNFFDFTSSDGQAAIDSWERIDDVIMGGVSSSRLAKSSTGAVFTGRIREDGGGFCGQRMKLLSKPIDLSASDGIFLDCAAEVASKPVDAEKAAHVISDVLRRGLYVPESDQKEKLERICILLGCEAPTAMIPADEDAEKAADIISDVLRTGRYVPDQKDKLEQILTLLGREALSSSATTVASKPVDAEKAAHIISDVLRRGLYVLESDQKEKLERICTLLGCEAPTVMIPADEDAEKAADIISDVLRTGRYVPDQKDKLERILSLLGREAPSSSATTVGADPSKKVWKVALRTKQDRGEMLYQAEFVPPRERGIVKIPFDSFRLVRGPRIVPGVAPLDASQTNETYQMSIIVTKFRVSENLTALPDFQEGPFKLELFRVGDYLSSGSMSSDGFELPAPLTDAEQAAARPLPFKIFKPLFSFLFSEKARRRNAAKKLLQTRGSTRLQRFGLGWAWRKGATGGQLQAASGTAALVFRDTLRMILSVPARLLFRLFFIAARTLKKLKGEPKLKPELEQEPVVAANATAASDEIDEESTAVVPSVESKPVEPEKAANIIGDVLKSGLHAPDQKEKLERTMTLLGEEAPSSTGTTVTTPLEEQEEKAVAEPEVTEESQADFVLVTKPGRRWQVTTDSGLVVKEDWRLRGAYYPARLTEGALIEEVDTKTTPRTNRMKYRLLEGTGPKEGWVSYKVKGTPTVREVTK